MYSVKSRNPVMRLALCPHLIQWLLSMTDSLYPSRHSLSIALLMISGFGLEAALAPHLQALPVSAAPSASDLRVPQTLAAATTLFVNPSQGNDQGNGSQSAPLKTIARALELAESGTVIQLAPGTYSVETGEKFPLKLKSGITLQGNAQTRGKDIVIRGGGFFLSPTSAKQDIAILGANQCTVTGVTISNPNPRGYGLWIESSAPSVIENTFTASTHDGISVVGKATPSIQKNTFYKNGANGMTLFGSSNAIVQENIFESTGFGINVGMKATPKLVKNVIRSNKDGVVVQASGSPILRGNLIEQNERDGLVMISMASPDLGSKAEPGTNIFRNNHRFDVNNSARNTLALAYGNQWLNTKINGTVNQSGSALPQTGTIAGLPTAPALPKTVNLPNPSPLPKTTTARQPQPSTLPQTPRALPARQLTAVSPTPSRPSPVASGIAVGGDLPPLPSRDTSAINPVRIPVKPTPNSNKPLFSSSGLATIRGAKPLPAPKEPTQLPELSPAPAPTQMATLPPRTANTGSNAIDIPVPPPETLPTAAPRRSGSTSSLPALSSLPSPPDLNRADDSLPAPPPLQTASSSLPVLDAAPLPSGVLPVPKGKIPIGNGGEIASGTVPPPPSTVNPSSLGLRYRVVVVANSSAEQAKVKSLVPGAFRVFSAGKVIMQVGAYSDQAEADELVQRLSSSGVQAEIQNYN